MDSTFSGEGLAILQLDKWDPSCLQLNLSEFREAFISPTRELLLLMSYNCEALLLPLIRGDSSNSSFLQSSQGKSLQTSCPLEQHVATSNLPSRSDLKDDFQCSSGSAKDFDYGVPLESKFPKSHSYPFVFDVKSSAWGVCGDIYNQHSDVLFREFLFVCSSQGVIVHAFCLSDQTSALEGTVEGDFQQGRWMDWGPTESGPSIGEVVSSTSCSEYSVIGGNFPNGQGKTPKGEDGYDELSRISAPKRWLRSFFTKAETVESGGNIWTKFPGKLAFPPSAKVVSFSIFDSDSPLVDFPSHGASSNKDECPQEAVLDIENDMPMNSSPSSSVLNHKYTVSPDFFRVGGNDLSKCFRVFSSNSHRVIGFVFNLVDTLSVNISNDSEARRVGKLLILIARLDGWGIRWVSSVKLEEHVHNCPVVEWTDFCFSENLLVCLNASGFIFFYDAMSGNYVAHLDILQSCGLSPQSKLQERQPVAADMEIKQVDEVHDNSTSRLVDFVRKKTFRRLIVASYTSLLAAVDEYGVIYVIRAADYVPDRYYSFDKLIPNLHRLGLGRLVSWEVAGSDIGHQNLQCNFSCSSRVNDSSTWNRNSNFLDNPGSFLSEELHNCKYHGKDEHCDFCLSGFSSASKILRQRSVYSVLQSPLMRKIFLPTDGHDDNDCIFFSPLGITRLIRKHGVRDHNSKRIVHSDLHTVLGIIGDRCLDIGGQSPFLQGKEESHVGEAIGCTFQGCFYLVTQTGLSVVLPSVSVSSNFLPLETLGYRQTCINTCIQHQGKSDTVITHLKQPLTPWKVEVLDRVLLYEGPEEADRLCLENGWNLKISRIRRLQLALHYLDFDEVARSLEMLVDVNLAEEGILRLLFAAVFLMVHKSSNDMEVSAASRLLSLATSFATKMIRNYGSQQLKKDGYNLQNFGGSHLLSLPPVSMEKDHDDSGISGKLHEMAHFLEIIRNMQCRLCAQYKKPGQGSVDSADVLSVVDTNASQDESQLSIVTSDSVLLEMYNGQELSFPVSTMGSNSAEKLALTSKNALDSIKDDSDSVSTLVLHANILGKNVLPVENPKDMMARWKLNNLDLKTVVKDALLSGRLPLAVLQLHLHHSKDVVADKESPDTFTEVRDIGRAIAYDLFLKGETGLAVLMLQRLGEDIETCLKQLLFGTVRRSLRLQVAEEMRRFGYLGPYEWKMLERILLVERLYPSGSFWKTFFARQKELRIFTSSSSPGGVNLCLLHPHLFNDLLIECGEIDGVVLGSWTSFSEDCSDHLVDEDGARAGYWSAAAVWSNAWDQKTIDRIALDQPFLMGVHVLWESKLEYYVCHNDWEEVFKLLDLIPTSALLNGSLQVALDGLQPTSVVEGDADFPNNGRYICSVDELDAMCMDIPGIRIFRFSGNTASSMWLRRIMEQKLARNLIFLKEYWEDTAEIVSLMARSGFLTRINNIPAVEEDVAGSPSSVRRHHVDTVQALHKLVVHHCVRQNMPNLLDLYLDNHFVVLDNASLCSLLEAAGDCQWARWLLLSRIKGCEYDASFSNARTIMSRALAPDNSLLSVRDVDEIICNVDDIAEGGGEMAALATLMYAPAPVQNCLSSGSVKRHSGSSAQCTLENLRSTLQRFPTVWRTLVAACLGPDKACNFVATKTNNVLANYLNWRDNIFFSATRDTSLLQMLPCWFPKAVRRLIQLYVQGPLGWQSVSCLPTGESLLDRDVDFYINAEEHTEINAISWEASIQKHVEEELYDSSIEETGIGLEHHLHRGRALAAFNHILGIRVQKLKSEGQPNTSTLGQANVQSDVQTLLAPIVPSEESLISFAIPLAITHFEDSVLVASCSFLLELCGLSASMLRVDIAALRRISLYYKTTENSENYIKLSNGSAFHAVSHEGDPLESLARALAEEYLHQHSAKSTKANPNSPLSKQPSRALMLVLQHLENASLPLMVHGKTCGSWLSTGDGDGNELRSQQKVASQHWNLVTAFCQMHQLPLSTKYLVVLARDIDWVGFLSEAQIGGYTFDTVVQVASKEFGDPRLKIHILTVLKAMQSRKKTSLSSYSDAAEEHETLFSDENIYIHAELFRILADCEKQKNPGEALLKKAKELSWSVLAMIASCFPDVSPLYCLTVWLEITAARETSSIKVNDIASQISDNVGAAVEATNIQPSGSKILTLHYNRQNPKRRRLMEPIAVDASSDILSAYTGAKFSPHQGLMVEEKSKLEIGEKINVSSDSDEGPASLSKMVAVLCEQRLFVALLRAFDMFLPSCSLLPFIRALQAFSQMRLSEASAHLGSFSARIKEEPFHVVPNTGREGNIGKSWICSTALNAADAMLSTCPSPYEKRCLLQLLAATDFGDGGSAAAHYRRLYWKINLAEPSLRKDSGLHLGNGTLDDGSLLTALVKSGYWEQARNWARQLEASGGPWKSAIHHVTESQAESMVAEWKEFLWDVPEERVALWGHCQMLFIRYSFPALQAGLFFLRHAEAVEKDLPARELHELLLLSLQWLSGMITLSNPVYPLHLLREIETRVWLLAVESEAQMKNEGEFTLNSSCRSPLIGNTANIIDRTATIITKMDNHINTMQNRTSDKQDAREYNIAHHRNQAADASSSTSGGNMKTKRRAKGYTSSRRPLVDSVDKNTDPEDGSTPPNYRNDVPLLDENVKIELSFSKWEERVGPAELERAILSLLEFGQITAARQLQQKLSPGRVPSEFMLVDVALKLADLSTPRREVPILMLDEEVRTAIQSCNLSSEHHLINPLQVLESLPEILTEGSGRGLCRRIIAVVKAADILGLSFSEAFDKKPVELLQLLSLKAQESFQEACLLVQTHPMPPSSIAQILAESFLKGLLAAHRGGYMDSQKDEGPAPLLWRFSDFLKWAELCPSEPEIGHALMRLVITGQEIPHACEVELLILSHHFYKSSACLDGVDVLVSLAATRVEAYVSEGDFPCLARLITGVGNFHTLNFILGILIENGQLDLLLQKYSTATDTNTGTAEAVRGFRMAVLTSLQHFNPNDLDAFAMVYNHFDMKHETAALLESRAEHSCQQWFHLYNKDQNEDLLESMRYFIEAAEVHSSIDAGNKTRGACAQASLVSLQIRMPDFNWLNLSETNARRVLVEQSRFLEALIVAEAYGLNQPTEWVLVLWNQMLKPELTEQFVAEFVAVLPLQGSMLVELARFYRAEVAARGDQSQFSVWLTGGGLPAEWAKYLGRSFRCLLKRTRDLRLRLQLATIATGFTDVIDACTKVLDRVPETAGPLVLRKGHGGAYLPLM